MKPSNRDQLLGDGDGLFLRVRPNGTKTWIVEFQFQARRSKYTIGVYDRAGAAGENITGWLEDGRLSLAQARSLAAQWKSYRQGGRDPVADWKATLFARREAIEAAERAVRAEATQPSVRDLIDRFFAEHIAGKASASAIRYRLERLARIIGDRQIRDVTRQDVVAALRQIALGTRPGRTAKQLAGEVLIQAKRLWRYAETCELVLESCIAPLMRRDFDARPRKREVVLRLEEVVELWRALGDPAKCRADQVTVAAMRVLILTGQREREVCDAEWQEFDLAAGVWKIPAQRTKMRRAHLVHLAPQMVAILSTLKAATGSVRHVFPSPLKPNQAVYGRSVNNALLTLLKRGSLPNVPPCRVHDLRRTFITRLPDLGFEPFLAHKIANHVLPGVLAIYNHNEYLDKRRLAMDTWATRIETMANGANVVAFRPAA